MSVYTLIYGAIKRRKARTLFMNKGLLSEEPEA
jgi:hypothetical protein